MAKIDPAQNVAYRYFLLLILFFCVHANLSAQNANNYNGVDHRTVSRGNVTYYVNPANGDDNSNGKTANKAWKTFAHVNGIIFSAGDKIMVAGGGDLKESLYLVARGNSKSHVKVVFSEGIYNYYPETSFKRQFFITNTNDDAYSPKAIAIYIDSSAYVDVESRGAKFIMRGKMIETCVDHSENVSLHGITYDYKRPTVSELKVLKTDANYADLQIHPDSKYSIKDSLLTWEGEGWRCKPIWLWQELNTTTKELQRLDISMDNLKYAETGKNQVRVYFKSNPGFKTNFIYQSRDITRDCSGIFLVRSKNLRLKNININFMHGMGVVSQFCQNLLLDSVIVKPAANSGRTSSAWADILHFSGCRGKITISNSYLSGANDDAVNIHGTYLRIIETPKPNQVLVRFMHSQTFGFEAFVPGDSIGFIHAKTLLQYGLNVVQGVKRVNDKDILLTLKNPVTEKPEATDVVENITWTPEVWIHHNTIAQIPTRGVLVTTRRKTVIENNVFLHTHNSAISVADDAASWYESGMVNNMLIRNNKFNLCGEPAILIEPENTQNETSKVHSNIVIAHNWFQLQGSGAVSAKSTSNISIINNYFNVVDSSKKETDMVKFKDCVNTSVSQNKVIYTKNIQ
ncbi:right-handed parallel beta-helix repeat-containing protein [Mucilaginibacter dorajii]|uniref:Right-handed parallel beta-helix repeat-containing protein n=1 Tax=Mucilaginibacter dorajii TaxID=692994 RepID=A0ABP7QWG3_9SPHI|nr:right-handed parallel beta-helix repeat-containing protein [Mucilaginibacter dorajii]MCS3732481.1 hypothetical protein [Mucilaginibacter dorajii]